MLPLGLGFRVCTHPLEALFAVTCAVRSVRAAFTVRSICDIGKHSIRCTLVPVENMYIYKVVMMVMIYE